MKRIQTIILTAALLIANSASAGLIFYNDETDFLSAASGTVFEDFEGATAAGTSVDFGAGDFSCSGTEFCPGFFGTSNFTARSGSTSVFFASPDTATFSFDVGISAFGIWVTGHGDVAPLDLVLSTSNGDSVLALDDYFVGFLPTSSTNFSGENTAFFGLIDTMGLFTSVTLSPSNNADGIFLDDLYYGSSGFAVEVAEPGTLALIGLGLFGLAIARRRHNA